MKISLYLEFYHFLGGALYKKIGTGLLSSYRNQKNILESLGINYTEKWDDSCDIFQTNTPWLKSIYLMKKAKRQGKKVIVWAHVTVEDSLQVFRLVRFAASPYKKYLSYAYNLADLIFTPSEYTKSLLVAYGLPAEKIVVQSNGINLKKYFKDEKIRKLGREKYGLENITVATMGLVIPRKGIETFLHLAKKFPEHHFRWHGKIYNSLWAKGLPKKLPANAKFTGYIDDVNEAYNAMDIFVFPSYEENEGMAILEAASFGLPILVRDIPVYRGWLIHGENCLKAKNNKEFEEYLKLLISDKNLKLKLGANAKKLAYSRNLITLAHQAHSHYKKLLSSGS